MTKITLQDNELTISFDFQGEPTQKEIVEAAIFVLERALGERCAETSGRLCEMNEESHPVSGGSIIKFLNRYLVSSISLDTLLKEWTLGTNDIL